ncbi:hypothetical protein ABTJ92_22030, partial [Acinetobacter baumannii]
NASNRSTGDSPASQEFVDSVGESSRGSNSPFACRRRSCPNGVVREQLIVCEVLTIANRFAAHMPMDFGD